LGSSSQQDIPGTDRSHTSFRRSLQDTVSVLMSQRRSNCQEDRCHLCCLDHQEGRARLTQIYNSNRHRISCLFLRRCRRSCPFRRSSILLCMVCSHRHLCRQSSACKFRVRMESARLLLMGTDDPWDRDLTRLYQLHAHPEKLRFRFSIRLGSKCQDCNLQSAGQEEYPTRLASSTFQACRVCSHLAFRC